MRRITRTPRESAVRVEATLFPADGPDVVGGRCSYARVERVPEMRLGTGAATPFDPTPGTGVATLPPDNPHRGP